MLAEFSFLRHPLEKIIRYGSILVPGIQRIDVIFYDERSKILMARTAIPEMPSPFGQIMEIKAVLPGIEKLRKSKVDFDWLEKDQIPWTAPAHENIRKSDLLSELEKSVLMITVPSAEMKPKRDLIFFYFNKNLNNLRLTSSTKEITVREKDIIGRSYVSSVYAMVQASKEDKDVWEDFEPSFRSNGSNIQNLRTELEQVRRMYQERLVASCQFYLSKLSLQYSRNYVFSAGALEQIRKYEGEYFKLENAIKTGVRIANNLHIYASTDAVEISEFYLNFSTSKRREEIHDTHIHTELEKPFNYLNQLEEIAGKIRKRNLPLTAKNVADQMSPPVKPSAITMYLNSHYDKVLKLFTFYADKWSILRSEFKPTYNLLENAKNRPHKGA